MIKYELIPGQLIYKGIITPQDLHSPEPVDASVVLKTHKKSYWEKLRNLTLERAEIRRVGLPLSSQLIERETRIVQGTINGCIHALEHKIALNVAGGTHHAGSDWGEGFCLLNDQAIAANFLLDNGLAHRILIIDLDVHQGNGTAEIFAHEDRVFTFSMHAANNFPFRKERSDMDIGLSDGTAGDEYLRILRKQLPELIWRFRPDFVFYLSGVDVLGTDMLGKLNLSIPECMERDRMVISLCHAGSIPIQISMGGGYSSRVGHIVDAHCNTFLIALDLYF